MKLIFLLLIVDLYFFKSLLLYGLLVFFILKWLFKVWINIVSLNVKMLNVWFRVFLIKFF